LQELEEHQRLVADLTSAAGRSAEYIKQLQQQLQQQQRMEPQPQQLLLQQTPGGASPASSTRYLSTHAVQACSVC